MEYSVNESRMIAIADAIRSKTETTDTMTIDEMPEKINRIEKNTNSCKLYTDWYTFEPNGIFYGYIDINNNLISNSNSNTYLDLSPYVGQCIYAIGNSNIGETISDRFSVYISDLDIYVPCSEEDLSWGDPISFGVYTYDYKWGFIVPNYDISVSYDPGNTG